MGKRRKHGKRTPPLLRLPPALLERIFLNEDDDDDSTITRHNFLLCKALLPLTLKVLYRDISISSRSTLAQLVAALALRPHLAEAIVSLSMGYKSTKRSTFRFLTGEKPGQLDRLLECSEEYAPETVVVDVTLAQDFLRRCTGLRSLQVVTPPVAFPLLSLRFLQTNPLPHLDDLTIDLYISEKVGGHYDCLNSVNFLAALKQHLPALTTLDLTQSQFSMPLSLGIAPEAYIAPRSWALRTFELHYFRFITPEFRTVLSSFTNSLEELALHSLNPYPSLIVDLQLLLPSSLRSLTLNFGFGCSSSKRLVSDDPEMPPFDIPLPLPNLVDLVLRGKIVTPSTFSIICESFSSLRNLELKSHTYLALPALLSLLDGPTAVETLNCLEVNVCWCPFIPPGLTSPLRRRSGVPRWSEDFDEDDAGELLGAAVDAGVYLGGNVLCALAICDHVEGEMCEAS